LCKLSLFHWIFYKKAPKVRRNTACGNAAGKLTKIISSGNAAEFWRVEKKSKLRPFIACGVLVIDSCMVAAGCQTFAPLAQVLGKCKIFRLKQIIMQKFMVYFLDKKPELVCFKNRMAGNDPVIVELDGKKRIFVHVDDESETVLLEVEEIDTDSSSYLTRLRKIKLHFREK